MNEQGKPKILVVEYDPEVGIDNLLDICCAEGNGAGRKTDNYWIFSTRSKFNHDCTDSVNIFNNIVFNAEQQGFDYIQIVKHKILKETKQQEVTDGTI